MPIVRNPISNLLRPLAVGLLLLAFETLTGVWDVLAMHKGRVIAIPED